MEDIIVMLQLPGFHCRFLGLQGECTLWILLRVQVGDRGLNRHQYHFGVCLNSPVL